MLYLFKKKQWFGINDIEKPDDRDIQRKGDQIDQWTIYRFKKIIITNRYHDSHNGHNRKQEQAIHAVYPADRVHIGTYVLLQ